MNLVGTLGKMLLSGAMSKGGAGGLGSLLGGAAGGQEGGAGGLGGLLGSLAGGQAGGSGGLGDLLGKLQQGGGAEALGGLLGQTQQGQAGAASGAAAGGGLLGGLLGGDAASGGGLGGMLGAALGQQMPNAQAAPAPTAQETDHAALLIRAMVNAAKSDGSVDQKEQEKIVGQLGDIGQEEANFIRAEMQAPLDVAGFVRSVPRGMEQQVYLLSLMSINLDSKAEADYLDTLAKGMNITEQVSNQLHTEIGAPLLYS